MPPAARTQQTFQLPDRRVSVHQWHGEADLNAPFAAHCRGLAQKLPNVEAKLYPGEGHILLIHKYLKPIIEPVMA